MKIRRRLRLRRRRRGREEPPPPVEQPIAPFPEGAGFMWAMHGGRESVTVEREEPVLRPLADAMNYWNASAGWELFVFGPSGENTSAVRVEVGRWWGCTWGSEPPYDHAWVTYPPNAAQDSYRIFAHELGHALGFGHQIDGALGAVFPDEAFDRRLLVAAGYV